MKKIKLVLLLVMFMIPVSVRADHMYTVDMDIDILKDGTANITEVWDVRATTGTEWYKTMYDLDGSKLSNFVVYMDGNKLQYDSSWNVNGSLSDKAGYYGINYSTDGMELCFGKSDMKRHKFTLKYTLSNYIFNTDDSQVLYWTLMPRVTVNYFSVNVSSYYTFPDNLDVWGYGYKGFAYVKDGKIMMSEDVSLNNDYVVLLAKFPLGTFDTNFRLSKFNTFQDVYNDAQEGSFEYDYDNDYISDNEYFSNSELGFSGWFGTLFPFVLFIGVFFVGIRKATENKYGYSGNKTIDKKEVPMFRDIPCNKDIFYGNILLKLNDFKYNKFNILGAVILKWVKEDRIRFENKEGGIFNKETSVIVLNNTCVFNNRLEKELYETLDIASNNHVLETGELERWAKSNYESFLELFSSIEENEISNLRYKGHIYDRLYRNECKKPYIMDDKIYNDSIELYGLKKYLLEFSKIDTKEVMDVKLWDEYLMFAYLFGIADKVAKQLKNMYPELLEQSNVDYETIEFIERISDRSVSKAENAKYVDEQREAMRESARRSASSYSSGGGGFSRGGGGSGSRGGGSRGSMGGR